MATNQLLEPLSTVEAVCQWRRWWRHQTVGRREVTSAEVSDVRTTSSNSLLGRVERWTTEPCAADTSTWTRPSSRRRRDDVKSTHTDRLTDCTECCCSYTAAAAAAAARCARCCPLRQRAVALAAAATATATATAATEQVTDVAANWHRQLCVKKLSKG